MNGDIKASNSKCQKAQGDHHGQKKCRFYLLLCVAKVKFCQVYFKYLNFTKCTPSNSSIQKYVSKVKMKKVQVQKCYQILITESSQKSLVNELSLEIGVCPFELSMAHQGLVLLLPPLEFHFYEWFEWGCCSLSLPERVVFISRVSNSGQ